MTSEEIAAAEKRAVHENYLQRVLVGFDQWTNEITGGLPDETISARAERLAIGGNEFAKLLSKGLDLIQKHHGERAEAGDLARAKQVEAVEEKALNAKDP